MMEHVKHAKSKKKTENISGVKSAATRNLWEDVPLRQGTYQGGSRGYHRFPAADWPASGQRQCIAGGATQQQQHPLTRHRVLAHYGCFCHPA